MTALKFKSTFFILLMLAANSVFAENIRAVVDRNTLALNDVFNFQIVVENLDANPDVDISPVLAEFSVISGPSRHTSMNWVNGKMSSTRKISWTLVPKKAGKLKIPALTVVVGKKTIVTEPIMMNVVKNAAQDSNEDLFILVEIDRDKAYLGQQITVTYKLYTRVNMNIQDLQLPEFRGFWSEELYLPKQIDFRDATLKGVSYKVANLYKVALFPTALGHITLPPLVLKTQVETRRTTKARRSIFDDPFFNSLDPFGRQMVPKILRSEDVSLNIIDFPDPVPKGFDNAVGSFEISAVLDSSILKVNEATTVRLTIKGTGNLNLITLPEPVFPDGLEVFPPTTSIEKDPFRDQITGKAKWEYIVIPRIAGKMIIPSISVVVFDPVKKQWDTLITKAQEITVHPGLETTYSSPSLSREEIRLLSSDIRYLHTGIPDWNYINFTVKKTLVVTFYMLAALTFIFPAVSTRFKRSRSKSYLQRRSGSAAGKALKVLRSSRGDEYATASRAVYQFLRDRFYLKTEKLDPFQVEKDLKNIIPNKNLNELVAFLKRCDAGRYAPGNESGLNDPLKVARELIKRLNRNG